MRKTTTWFSLAIGTFMVGAPPAHADPPALQSVEFFGGSGDQRAASVVSDGAHLYAFGTTCFTVACSLFTAGSLAIDYPLPLGAPGWSAGSVGSFFHGGTLDASSLFPVGSAVPSACGASDGVGSTEAKSLVARYDTSGTLLGCGSPNFFPYRGWEEYYGAVSVAPFVYATGYAESCGFGHLVFVLSKYDAVGNLLGTVTEPGATIGAGGCIGGSFGTAIAELGGNLYVAGMSNLTSEDGFGSFVRPVLMRYSTGLARDWKVRVADVGHGQFYAVTTHDAAVYAAGHVDGSGLDYLIEKYDEAGTRVWSRVSGGSGDDVVRGLAWASGRLFAAGWTTGPGSSGGADAVVLEIDPDTGDTLSTTLYGGAQDDLANAIVAVGNDLYVAGESRSFAEAGNTVGANDALILHYSTLLLESRVQPPIDADGSSVFRASRGVVPVKFTLTRDGAATCDLPPATISLSRTAGGAPGPIDEGTYSGSADRGSNFRQSDCQYVYNLQSKSLGVGTYRVSIAIDGVEVGDATFGLN